LFSPNSDYKTPNRLLPIIPKFLGLSEHKLLQWVPTRARLHTLEGITTINVKPFTASLRLKRQYQLQILHRKAHLKKSTGKRVTGAIIPDGCLSYVHASGRHPKDTVDHPTSKYLISIFYCHYRNHRLRHRHHHK
jgi:hypothetical protein